MRGDVGASLTLAAKPSTPNPDQRADGALAPTAAKIRR